MQDRSNVQQPWFSLGSIEGSDLGWMIRGLLVRWNERQAPRQTEAGQEIEYIYDAHRFNYKLPVGVQPGQEAVEYYLEQAKTAVTQLAQDLMAQEEGFHAD